MDRTVKRQMKTLQASAPSGVSLYFRPHQGASSELPAFMAAIDTFAHSLPPGLVVVADSGLGYLENLRVLDSSKVSFSCRCAPTPAGKHASWTKCRQAFER